MVALWLRPLLLGIDFAADLTLGDALVAFGTILLALITGFLALQTRRDVQVSREAIEEQGRPYVIVTPVPGLSGSPWSGSGNRWLLTLGLWNLGKGPAIVRDVQLNVGDTEYLTPLRQQIIVHAGGQADVDLSGNQQPPAGEQGAQLRVYYLHSSGAIYRTESNAKLSKSGFRPTTFSRSKTEEGMRGMWG